TSTGSRRGGDGAASANVQTVIVPRKHQAEGARLGNSMATAAAASGTNAIPNNVRSIPARSAIAPTSGTLNPPMPHANPIISDDTVAALTGGSAWPNATLTASADCM